MTSGSRDSERLTLALHTARAHPDFEYATTHTARKSGETRLPEGDGWEPNDFIEMGSNPTTGVPYPRRNWERFEYHEEEYWRRRKPKSAAPLPVEGETDVPGVDFTPANCGPGCGHPPVVGDQPEEADTVNDEGETVNACDFCGNEIDDSDAYCQGCGDL